MPVILEKISIYVVLSLPLFVYLFKCYYLSGILYSFKFCKCEIILLLLLFLI